MKVIFFYGLRASYRMSATKFDRYYVKNATCTGPLNNNRPFGPKHLNKTADIGITDDITMSFGLAMFISAKFQRHAHSRPPRDVSRDINKNTASPAQGDINDVRWINN